MLRFLGIGAQKAGTTWLFQNLKRHPRVRFPGGKEVHYWNQRIQHEAPQWYQGLFSATPGLVEGDITPAYGLLSRERIETIHQRFPDIRVILIMRDPVARAWSSALMALSRSELRFHEASDQWFIDHFRSEGSLLRGDYLRTLGNWTGVYGEEQLRWWLFDDIQHEPVRLMREVSAFLGLEWIGDWATPSVSQVVFEGTGNALRPALRDVLVDIYEPQVTLLEQRLSISLDSWRQAWLG